MSHQQEKQGVIDLWLTKVKTSGGLAPCEELKTAPEFVRSNKDVVRSAIERSTRNMEYASDVLKNDQNFIMECLDKNRENESDTCLVEGILDYVNPELLDDSDFMLRIAKLGMRLNGYASTRLMEDGDFVVSVIDAIPNTLGELHALGRVLVPLENYEKILTAFYDKLPRYFFYLKTETNWFTTNQYDEVEHSLHGSIDFHKEQLEEIFKKYCERRVSGTPLYWQMTIEHHLKALNHKNLCEFKEKVFKEYQKEKDQNLALLLSLVDKEFLLKLKQEQPNQQQSKSKNRKQILKRSLP